MATESLMRVMETTGHDKWLKSEESSSSQHNRASEELEMLLKEHKFLGSGREAVPNRSGSAPPTMEGSLAAIENVVAKRNSNEDTSLANLNKARVQLESEELSRADPAYLAYYRSNVNLNPRLPPPLISHENQRLVCQVGGSLQLSRAALSTHEEEPEDDKTTAYIDLAEGPDMISLEDLGASLLGRHKSLVDLIQEDFPRTPSPVYNQSRSSSHVASEEGVDPESLSNSLPDPSVETSDTKELNVTSITNASSKPTLPEIDVGYVQNRDTQSVLSISSLERTSSSLSDRKGKSISPDTHLEDGSLISGTSMADSDVTSIESEMKVLNIDNSPSNLGNRYQQNLQHAQQTNLHPQRGGDTYQVLGIQSHVLTQLVDQPYHGYPFGISPSPIYATQTPFMGSASTFYPNLQTSAVFAPPYNLAGYGLNSAFHPPVIAGYPPQVAIPVAFDNTGTPNFDARPSGVPTGGGFVPGVDLQHAYGFYGQPGLVVPPFTDPYMHYIQHCPDEAYNALNQSNPLVSGGGVIGSHPHNGALVAAYSADQQPLLQTSGAFSLPNQRNTMFTYPSYYGSPPNVDVSMHFPTPPLLSPIMPGSPMSRISPSGSRNEMRFSPSSSQNSGWPRQRGPTKFDNPRAYSYLEDLKSNTGRKFELSDIAECIVPFSADQHGSRFIQQKLETCGVEEKASVFKEILPHAFKLMSDVFGNYVIQKFFEHGSTEQRKELADQLAGHILPLSMQMYGCRVIQKALEVIGIDQKIELVNELDGHVLRCVRDQNGNHVIQKCIECVPSDRIEFIISAFHGQVGSLSTHPYGCRVIQRVLEFCTDEQQSQSIVDEILESACVLAQDQYGNYVTQHVLERGKPQERSKLIHKLAGKVIQMSHHKFASNVVEKCLEYGDTAERDLLVEEVVGQTEGNDNLLIMMKDQFANYVVQKILEICNDNQREILLSRIRIHLDALRKYTYGKHIVLRFEQLVGEEEIPASET